LIVRTEILDLMHQFIFRHGIPPFLLSYHRPAQFTRTRGERKPRLLFSVSVIQWEKSSLELSS
jgi:hypothetical protein